MNNIITIYISSADNNIITSNIIISPLHVDTWAYTQWDALQDVIQVIIHSILQLIARV